MVISSDTSGFLHSVISCLNGSKPRCSHGWPSAKWLTWFSSTTESQKRFRGNQWSDEIWLFVFENINVFGVNSVSNQNMLIKSCATSARLLQIRATHKLGTSVFFFFAQTHTTNLFINCSWLVSVLLTKLAWQGRDCSGFACYNNILVCNILFLYFLLFIMPLINWIFHHAVRYRKQI